LIFFEVVLKVDDNFGKRKSQPKRARACYFLYI